MARPSRHRRPADRLELPRPQPHRDRLHGRARGGFPYNPDVTGAVQEGAGPFQATIGPKGRASVAATFLRPAMDRPNLHVLTHAHVTRILIEDGRATGVAFVHMGRSEEVQAGEVILCGGAINSPQTLMLSGIGPAISRPRHRAGA